ncbi:unnamed protein product, partial [Polarella glacialis]
LWRRRERRVLRATGGSSCRPWRRRCKAAPPHAHQSAPRRTARRAQRSASCRSRPSTGRGTSFKWQLAAARWVWSLAC